MKLLYIANARLPTEKAHGVQIMKMCEAFTQNGGEVELVAPFRVQSAQMRRVRNLWDYYGIRQRFKLTRLPALDLVFLDRYLPDRLFYLPFYVQALTFGVCAVLYSLLRRADVLYSRDWMFFLLWLPWRWWRKRTLVLEEHTFPHRGGWGARLHLAVSRRVDRLVVITQRLKELYIAAGVPAARILVAPDGVDLARFEELPSKEEARRQLGLPLVSKVICYTGHLFAWKGVYTLVDAASRLPDALLLIVGGMAQDREKLQQYLVERSIENVRLVPHIPPSEVPCFLAAADVLVLPSSAQQTISREYTSPLKLFEYMASGTPIVATDLPSTREVLRDGRDAILVPPDDPEALAKGLRQVLERPDRGRQLAAQARRDVASFTWERRAARILSFVRAR
ncbi:MAG: glycosyltransferase family 4 protein [Anaerolineae bacterium]|nr:glycosyltransferase family 4 protein [Anaerolineae bacterium]